MLEATHDINESSQKSLAFLIKDYASYNLWANKKLVNWLKTKPLDIVECSVSSSFPSIRLTLVHIWDVERSWLGNLLQVQTESNYGKDYDGPLEEVFESVVKQSEALDAYVRSLTETSLQEGCKFMIPIRWPEWDEFVRPRFEIIQHCLNHSSYHRGQIVTIARNVGLTDPPNTDFISFSLIK
jgi:uncharacterized damage-inducible protein DinB